MSSTQAIIAVFGLAYLIYVARLRRRGDFAEFAVGSGGVGQGLIFCSLAATYVGPAMTMGLARAGARSGLLLIPCAFLAALNLWLVARFVAGRLRQRFPQARSIGDIAACGPANAQRSIKLFVGAIGFALTLAISIVMSKAGGELLHQFFGLERWLAIAAMAAIVTLYSSFGGIRATMQTDAFQFLCFVLLLPAVLIAMIFRSGASMADVTAATLQTTRAAWDSQTAGSLFALLVFWLLGSGFDPTFIHRILASKSPATARASVVSTALFVAPWMAMMYLLGSIGHAVFPQFPDTDALLLQVAQEAFAPVLYGLFAVAMIGVVMSSQDSMLNAAAVVFTNDIAAAFRANMDDRAKLRLSMVVTLAVGAISATVAIYVDSILRAIILIWSVYTPAIAPTIVAAAYVKRRYWQSSAVSMILGLAGGGSIVAIELSVAIPPVLVGLLASCLGYALVQRLCSNARPAPVERLISDPYERSHLEN